MTPSELEAKRILAEYERRERAIGRDYYSSSRPENLFVRQGQQRAMLDALTSAQLLPLDQRRILEVGCGLGRWLATFEEFGAKRGCLHGVDLDAARLDEAKARFEGADLRVADATALPWRAESFDVVFQSLVFTSILDDRVRQQVADEMRRVLAPGGAILWYDFSYNNPANPNVRGIGAREIAALFPSCEVVLRRTTLAPPLARRLVPRSWMLATILERARLLNTHYFAVIRLR